MAYFGKTNPKYFQYFSLSRTRLVPQRAAGLLPGIDAALDVAARSINLGTHAATFAAHIKSSGADNETSGGHPRQLKLVSECLV
jgi:hypothetical protein